MRSFKTEGFVIKRRNFQESDRIITVLTKNYGKIQIKASGVRKITSRRSSHVELLNQSRLSLYKGRNLPVLTEVEVINNFQEIKEDLKKIGFAYHICEIVDGLCAENQENEAIFDLLKNTLEKLCKDKEPTKLIYEFEMELLSALGFYKNPKVQNFDTKTFIERLLERKLKSRQFFPEFS